MKRDTQRTLVTPTLGHFTDLWHTDLKSHFYFLLNETKFPESRRKTKRNRLQLLESPDSFVGISGGGSGQPRSFIREKLSVSNVGKGSLGYDQISSRVGERAETMRHLSTSQYITNIQVYLKNVLYSLLKSVFSTRNSNFIIGNQGLNV